MKTLKISVALATLTLALISPQVQGMGRVSRTRYIEKINELNTLKTELAIVQKELALALAQVRSLSNANDHLIKNLHADGGTLKQSIAELLEERIELINKIKNISLETAKENIKDKNPPNADIELK